MTDVPRPKHHLIEAGRRYPEAWRLIDEMRANRPIGEGAPNTRVNMCRPWSRRGLFCLGSPPIQTADCLKTELLTGFCTFMAKFVFYQMTKGGNVKWHRTTEGRKVATRGTFAATVPIGQPKIMMLAIPNHHPESCATNAKVKRPQAIAPKCRYSLPKVRMMLESRKSTGQLRRGCNLSPSCTRIDQSSVDRQPGFASA